MINYFQEDYLIGHLFYLLSCASQQRRLSVNKTTFTGLVLVNLIWRNSLFSNPIRSKKIQSLCPNHDKVQTWRKTFGCFCKYFCQVFYQFDRLHEELISYDRLREDLISCDRLRDEAISRKGSLPFVINITIFHNGLLLHSRFKIIFVIVWWWKWIGIIYVFLLSFYNKKLKILVKKTSVCVGSHITRNHNIWWLGHSPIFGTQTWVFPLILKGSGGCWNK